MEDIQHKIGFKGLNSNLKGMYGTENFSDFTIEYRKELPKGKIVPQLCTNEGYHYCKDIQQVNSHYNFNIHFNNRYFIIEDTGASSGDSTKIITTAFKFIKEITDLVRSKNWDEIAKLHADEVAKWLVDHADDIEKAKHLKYVDDIKKKAVEEFIAKKQEQKEEKENKEKKYLDSAMHIDLVIELQKAYPHLIIGGSTALYLHGVKLERYAHAESDIDLIAPYFTLLEDFGDNQVIHDFEDKTDPFSGQSFTEIMKIKPKVGLEVKAEILVSPTERYEYITYNGAKLKVNSLGAIWAAKIGYNKPKHNHDLREALGLEVGDKPKKVGIEDIDDYDF